MKKPTEVPGIRGLGEWPGAGSNRRPTAFQMELARILGFADDFQNGLAGVTTTASRDGTPSLPSADDTESPPRPCVLLLRARVSVADAV